MSEKAKKGVAMGETVFDLVYLCLALFVGLWLLAHANGREVVRLYGCMALVLGGGDAFHLLPRVWRLQKGTSPACQKALGWGKMITSVTMTLFYVLLFYIWRGLYALDAPGWLTAAVWGLAAVRIVLCLCPQNGWVSAEPPLSWAVARNLPFAALGLLVLVLFAWRSAPPLQWMWLAILLSFGFYIPVVLGAPKKPMLGMLMLPKTCAYVWMLLMGLGLL